MPRRDDEGATARFLCVGSSRDGLGHLVLVALTGQNSLPSPILFPIASTVNHILASHDGL